MTIRIQKLVSFTFGVGLAIAASTIAASAVTLLSDGTFSSATATASHAADPNTIISTQTPCLSCGNTGAGLQDTFIFASSTLQNSSADVGLIDNNLTYDPQTQGAIASINASYDRLITTTNFDASNLPFNFRLVIEQDSNFYVATVIGATHVSTTNGFFTLSASDLTALSFLSYDFATGVSGTGHPNFAGDLITFGILGLSTKNVSVGTDETVNAYFDNINIEVSQTPLPAALPLFASGLGALGLLGWRRKRKAAALAT